jgi:hypothetical protein
MQIGRHPLDLLVPVLQAAAPQKRCEQVARPRLVGDFALQRFEPLAQHVMIEFAIEAGLALLQAEATGLKLLHQAQALSVGIRVDAIPVCLSLARQQPELLVVEQRRARQAHALRQFRNLIHPPPCPLTPILDRRGRPKV